MKHNALLAFAAATLAACDMAPTAPAGNRERPSFSAVTSNSNVTIPVDFLQFVPCANGGVGELVEVSGPLHMLSQVTGSTSGNALFYAHFQPQGVTGTGLVTGDKYQGTGITQTTSTFGTQFPVTRTFENSFYLIGPGPNNNFKVHETFHVTVNANGDVTAFADNFTVTCQ